jgi:dipeptidyl aminopeptidase/acylaminoacyl peptidase
VWSPNNTDVAFTSYRKGNADIYVKSTVGGEETPLLASPANEIVKAWSADGKYIAYLLEHDNVQDIYALPLSSDGKASPDAKPFPVVTGPFQKNEPQFSPDGHWLAYTAEAGGTFQVYVVAFPKGDRIVQISKDGGGQPRWGRDMKELFFKALDRSNMAVGIKVGAGIEPGTPQLLFNATGPSRNGDPTRHQLAVSSDGQRFLIDINPARVVRAAAGGQSSAPLTQPNFTPAAQTGSGAAGAAGPTTNGLTVVLGWPAAFAKGGK